MEKVYQNSKKNGDTLKCFSGHDSSRFRFASNKKYILYTWNTNKIYNSDCKRDGVGSISTRGNEMKK